MITKDKILLLLKNNKLHIRPLLDEDQISEIGIDFRLGCNFLIAIQGREPFINVTLNDDFGRSQRDIRQFFLETRRHVGETFILYPNQTVLASSLEYIKLPNDILLNIFMRSSYSRLGLTVSTIVQPGYSGCISIELTNTNSVPINLTVGARIFQGVLISTNEETHYFSKERKYMCNVRPEPSAAINDNDLTILNNLWKENNKT